MQMDSRRPSIPYKAFASAETRSREVLNSKDVESKLAEIQKRVDDRYAHYERLASVGADESEAQGSRKSE